jgi:hypothetical protein
VLRGEQTRLVTPELLRELHAAFGFDREELSLRLNWISAFYLTAVAAATLSNQAAAKHELLRLSRAAETFLAALTKLPAVLTGAVDDELVAKAGIHLFDAQEHGSLHRAVQVLIDIADDVKGPLRAGAPNKEHLVTTAKWLIELWEELSPNPFARNFRAPAGTFKAKGPRFVQLVLRAFDRHLSERQIERAIRAALASACDAENDALTPTDFQ